MQMAKAVIGADPNVTAAVLKQRACAEVGQAVPYRIVLCVAAGDAAYSFIGGYPYGAVSTLQECAHKVVDQPARSGVVDYAAMGQAIDAAAVRADPKITGTVA